MFNRIPTPDGSLFFAVAGGLSMAFWVIESAAGHHPDGSLMGFSAGMWAVWSAMRKDSQRRDRRKKRSREDPPRDRDKPADADDE